MKVIRFPLIRILLAVVFVMAAVLAFQIVLGLIGKIISLQSPPGALLAVAIACLVILYAYTAYVRLVEARRTVELSASGAFSEIGRGALLGLGLFSTIIFVLWLFGAYRATGLNSWLVLFPALLANIPSGLIQEIIFRGIIFRIVDEWVGTWAALLISAALFGLVHWFSANANLLSTVTIMVEAGFLLGAAYLLTRRLWLPIGVHIAWDLANDGIFGIGGSGLSGKPIAGLLRGELSGPAWLTGGVNGVEASLVTFLLLVLVSGFLLYRIYRRGGFVSRQARRQEAGLPQINVDNPQQD